MKSALKARPEYHQSAIIDDTIDYQSIVYVKLLICFDTESDWLHCSSFAFIFLNPEYQFR